VNSWFVPLVAYKGSDQSVTSSTTPVNDSALFVPLVANATYWFAAFIDYEGGTGGSSDLKWNYTVPAGANMRATASYRNTSGTAVTWNLMNASQSIAGTNGAGNVLGASVFGTIAMSSTAGNVQMQWAQNTSSGTATIVHTGSVILCNRIT